MLSVLNRFIKHKANQSKRINSKRCVDRYQNIIKLTVQRIEQKPMRDPFKAISWSSQHREPWEEQCSQVRLPNRRTNNSEKITPLSQELTNTQQKLSEEAPSRQPAGAPHSATRRARCPSGKAFKKTNKKPKTTTARNDLSNLVAYKSH